jgi:hypothetical protein
VGLKAPGPRPRSILRRCNDLAARREDGRTDPEGYELYAAPHPDGERLIVNRLPKQTPPMIHLLRNWRSVAPEWHEVSGNIAGHGSDGSSAQDDIDAKQDLRARLRSQASDPLGEE